MKYKVYNKRVLRAKPEPRMRVPIYLMAHSNSILRI